MLARRLRQDLRVNGLALMEISTDRPELPDDVVQVVAEILRYLDAHPHAADTVEGITRWWLTPELGALPIETLEHALAVLIGRGRVERAPLGDGRFVYRARPGNDT